MAIDMWGKDDEIPYESDEMIDYLISALNDDNQEIREKTTQALAQTGNEKVVLGLIESLKYHDWHSKDSNLKIRRMSSAEALGIIKDKRAIPHLIKSLSEDPDAEVRAKVAWALGNMNASESSEFLTMALYDGDWRVRSSAANSLGVVGDQDAVIPLFKLLDDNYEVVRQNAFVSLGNMDDNDSVTILLEFLRDKADGVVEQGMVIFEEIGEKAVDPLKNGLNDIDWRIRALAVEALGHVGGEDAQEALIGVLHGWLKKDNNYFVRAKAAEVLGIKGDENALKPLKKAYDKEHEQVRYNAYQSMKQIIRRINKSGFV